jgi:hypothetical protein
MPGHVCRLPGLEGFARPSVKNCAIPVDISQIGQYAPANLIGRDSETDTLSRAWDLAMRGEANTPYVLTITGMGGAGKSSLVAKWTSDLARQGWPGSAAVLAWSFYSQGTREGASVSSNSFIKYALAFFGDSVMAGNFQQPAVKGQRLAELIGQQRALLILDGLEPLQYPPGSQLPTYVSAAFEDVLAFDGDRIGTRSQIGAIET